MPETQSPEHTPSPTTGPGAAPRGRRRVSAVALVAGGVLAGGILASTMGASAETTDPGADESAAGAERFAPPGPGRGPHHAALDHGLLDSETAAQIEGAITDAYPGATVIRMGARPDGTYRAHIVEADDTHVAVTVDEGFAVTGSTALPTPLDSETAAAVEDAVLTEYPGATVIRMGALPEGGYAAHVVTADDRHVAVRLDEDLTVTGELTPDGIRQGVSDRLGRLGERFERGSDRLHHLGDRIDRLRERLDGDDSAAEPADDATALSSGYVA